LALGVQHGDLVWTSPITFVASANCARYCGADVDFVDIDPITFNMSADLLEAKLAKASKLPKVIIAVHMTGQPCEMERISELARRYGVMLIEDASHAIGAKYLNSTIGDCAYCDITVFSFHPVKIVTTAEGGLATTQNASLARKMQLFRSHGITRDQQDLESQDEGPWYYEQQCLGFNYRMTDMQAALGVSQMKSLELWIARRHQIADRYDSALGPLPLILPVRRAYACSALHLYVIQLDETKTSVSRRHLFEALRAANIGVNVHYIPVHIQPDYKKLGFHVGQFPNSETYYSRCISLPMYAGLTDEQQDHVIEQIRANLT
jgi:UDP-4-amino-4,6-dideoxy-N-acetyl-beta-L-altrosamine transaminase